MTEESYPEKEQKRLEKLRRARAQHGWNEAWLEHNDKADQDAGRKNKLRPRPQQQLDLRAKLIDELKDTYETLELVQKNMIAIANKFFKASKKSRGW